MIRLVLIFLFVFLTLPGRGQFIEKSFSLKDDFQRSQQVNLYSDGSFKEVTGNTLCECGSYSVGYYNLVGDTLMLIHRPYFQDSLQSTYALMSNELVIGSEASGDSIQVELSVYDLNNGLPLPVMAVTPDWEPGDKSGIFFTDQSGETEFNIVRRSNASLNIFNLGYEGLKVSIPDSNKSRIILSVGLVSRNIGSHQYVNEEYRIQKFLIHDLQQKITLESIPSGYVLTELDSVSRN